MVWCIEIALIAAKRHESVSGIPCCVADFRWNVAVGSSHFGFWFDILPGAQVLGDTRAFPAGVCASTSPLGTFELNTAYSNK